MEQHAIPQQISSYQFRLVGDMTLKQFFQLAGGFLVALIFYSAPLIGIIKWPFVIISAILGVALAFLPLEERPLEKWIFAFFKAIYAPTEFFWKRTHTPQKFFQDEVAEPSQENLTPQDSALKEYLSETPVKSGPLAKLEGAEKGFLSTLSGIFTGVGATVLPGFQTPQMAPVQPAAAPVTAAIKPEVSIPETPQIKVVPNVPKLVVEEKPTVAATFSPTITSHTVAPLIAGEEMVSTKAAVFSVDAAPPNPPTTPNVVVGQVVGADRKIVEGAIMEIRNSSGRPVRALRSNKLGHFITITPLENGQYSIITEKEGFEFSPVSFEANGNLIPPILVSGHLLTQ